MTPCYDRVTDLAVEIAAQLKALMTGGGETSAPTDKLFIAAGYLCVAQYCCERAQRLSDGETEAKA